MISDDNSNNNNNKNNKQILLSDTCVQISRNTSVSWVKRSLGGKKNTSWRFCELLRLNKYRMNESKVGDSLANFKVETTLIKDRKNDV